LKTDWQRHVLASSGYLELGMFDAAALVLEEIAPEDKTRNEVLGARVNLYMAAKKWDMVAAVAGASLVTRSSLLTRSAGSGRESIQGSASGFDNSPTLAYGFF
jgi:hypothetical protein